MPVASNEPDGDNAGIENQGVGMKLIRIALLLLSFSCGAAAHADATSDFQALLGEHWEWTLANSPVMASMMGDRRYNQEWGDNSPDAIEQAHVDTQAFLRRAYAIDRGALSPEDQLNYELFRRQLQDEVDEHQFEGHLIPFDHQGGIQNLDIMASRLSFNAVRSGHRAGGTRSQEGACCTRSLDAAHAGSDSGPDRGIRC
jgi:uncharacterized protein (DUF885 family)